MTKSYEQTPRTAATALSRGLVLGLLLTVMGVATGYMAGRWHSPSQPITDAAPTDPPATGDGVVRFEESRWEPAGIKVEPVAYAPFTERVWRTGHLTLDETRIAHVTPPAEGIVRDVFVRLGQSVKAGQRLAVIDSREVGRAKLDLVKARLATEFARIQQEWTVTVNKNAAELVELMAANTPIVEIERQFDNRPIGELRQQLMTAYSRRIQAKTQFESANVTGASAAIPTSSLVRLRSDLEAAEATFRALAEEIKYQTGQQVRAGEQKLREAQTTEAVCRSTLMMYGYKQSEIEAMDPIAEGPTVSLLPIVAPFDGVIIEQHAVLSERVETTHQLFQIADLSRLWLRADIPQSDLALARSLVQGKVRFRTADSDSLREANVFSTGQVVDATTRAVELLAEVANPDYDLKAGMFVTVELAQSHGMSVQVPAGAILRQGPQPFVFVHTGGDEFRRTDIQIGRFDNGNFEVLHGLTPGQPIVVTGGFVLKSELFKDQMAGE